MGRRVHNRENVKKSRIYSEDTLVFQLNPSEPTQLLLNGSPTCNEYFENYVPEFLLNIEDLFEAYKDPEVPDGYKVDRNYFYDCQKAAYSAEFLLSLREMYLGRILTILKDLRPEHPYVWAKHSVFHPDLLREFKTEKYYHEMYEYMSTSTHKISDLPTWRRTLLEFKQHITLGTRYQKLYHPLINIRGYLSRDLEKKIVGLFKEQGLVVCLDKIDYGIAIQIVLTDL